ncbi:unannotated protein [freshwater metagenome]|uniref:Unannotated protein n=1 Tax=freshwater metagenome TaxID=449393 RepID=A0A6J7FMF5_9ZZZZ|nr:hypothetical protein [Actinomycetota bacterium]
MARLLAFNAAELLRRPGTERLLDCTLTAAELGLADNRFTPDDAIEVHLRLESLNDGIVVVGSISVPWHGQCRRCLKPLAEVAVCDVDELYQTVVTNPEAFEIVDNQLDLSPMARELALLDAPDSPLCRPDCAGLCPVCGADSNQVLCGCAAPVVASQWAVLDQLKEQLGGNEI